MFVYVSLEMLLHSTKQILCQNYFSFAAVNNN